MGEVISYSVATSQWRLCQEGRKKMKLVGYVWVQNNWKIYSMHFGENGGNNYSTSLFCCKWIHFAYPNVFWMRAIHTSVRSAPGQLCTRQYDTVTFGGLLFGEERQYGCQWEEEREGGGGMEGAKDREKPSMRGGKKFSWGWNWRWRGCSDNFSGWHFAHCCMHPPGPLPECQTPTLSVSISVSLWIYLSAREEN